MSKKNILITGGAGFIGSHLSERLLELGHRVTSIDNFDQFYSKDIKESNLKNSFKHEQFKFFDISINEENKLSEELKDQYDILIHLAAKAGVRPSIENPLEYTKTNILGTQNLLEFARKKNIPKFIFASSSSIYGISPDIPWSEDSQDNQPISPYASTKLSGEIMGQVYSHLYDIQFIGLRFFTVYGPRQRPDLAIHKFIKKINEGTPIPFYGDGNTLRDYTYISDIIDGVLGAIDYDKTSYELFNLGNNEPITLKKLLDTIENVIKKKAILNQLPEQPGDVPKTYANIDKAKKYLNYNPTYNLETGLSNFYEWFKKKQL